MRQRPYRHRRGAIYMLILGSCLLVTVIGVAAVTAARIQARVALTGGDITQARMHARSAVDTAMHKIYKDPTWRTTYGNSNWPTDEPIGDGTFSIGVLDPEDANVPVGDSNPLIVTGVGKHGEAVQRLEVTLVPDAPPLEFLNTAIHVFDRLHISPGASLTVSAAAASTNENLNVEGTLYGDIDATIAVIGTGTVTGTTNAPAPAKTMPDPTTFDDYKARALALDYTERLFFCHR